MGEVWRGSDRRLNRPVAVKILPTSQRGVAARVDRFRREARIAAALQHPGITVVHDVGEHEGVLFFVMEHLKGEDLAAIIRKTPSGLPVDRVLHFGVQLAGALDAAHRRGVVHRDVKPANIMITEFDRVKICDFGVARVVQRIDGETGTAGIGTPLYTAPEQFEGRAGAPADLYSLGCVLYEALTGCTPFQGLPTELMHKHLHEAPAPVDALRPDVPEKLGALVMGLLEKSAEERPPDASSVAERLRALRRALREVRVRKDVIRFVAGNARSGSRAVPGRRTRSQVPPKSLLGVDGDDRSTPESESRAVRLGAILRSASDEEDVHPLTVGIGRGPDGVVMVNLADLAHLLIAGVRPTATTMTIHSLLTSILTHASPDEVRMVLAASSHDELSVYAGVPHLLTPPVTDPGSALGMLGWAEEEMDRRYDDLAAHGLRHIDAYNEAVRSGRFGRAGREGGAVAPYPYIVVVVAELAELTAVALPETVRLIGRLARLARAVGVHLVLGTRQVTDRTLLRGLRANIPSRTALRTDTTAESELIIDRPGAENLTDDEALFLAKGADEPVKVRRAAVTLRDIAAVVDHWAHGP